MIRKLLMTVLFSMATLLGINHAYASGNDKNHRTDTSTNWNVLFKGIVPPKSQAFFYYGNIFWVAVWDLKEPGNEVGKLHMYIQEDNKLVSYGTTVLKGIPEDPEDKGLQNFLGFTSDGTYIYGVNMSRNIYVIDPITMSVKELIRLQPECGFVSIAYDIQRDGFWCSDIYGVKAYFVRRDGVVFDGTINEEISLGYENYEIIGLAYDELTEGGPYLWSSAGGTYEYNMAKLGRWNISSGEYTPNVKNVKDMLGYPTLQGSIMGSIYIYQDYNAHKNVLAGIYTSENTIFGFDIGDISGPGSPKSVEGFTVIADPDGGMGATLSWSNPTKTVDGKELEGLISIRISREGELVHTINNPVKGEKENWKDNLMKENGVYSYTVIAVNSAGVGIPVSRSTYIGEDIPSAVKDITLKRNSSNSCAISWTHPVAGAHNGWIDQASLKYKITRNPGNVIVADDLTGTSFEDNFDFAMDHYSYTITSKNRAGEGNSVTSEKIVLGNAMKAPWTETFNNGNDINTFWTFINNNEDRYVWVFDPYNGVTKGTMICSSFGDIRNDDWMISPPIKLEVGKSYRLRWYSKVTNEPVTTVDAYRVTIGKGSTVSQQTTVLNIYKNNSDDEIIENNLTLAVDQTGEYNFGWHCVNHGETSCEVLIDDITIEEMPVSDMKTIGISGPDELILNTTGTYTVNVKNDGLLAIPEFTVDLWYTIDNGNRQMIGTEKITQALPAGNELEIKFNFTPIVKSPHLLQASVTALGDIKQSNDTTAVYTVEVLPDDVGKIYVGDPNTINLSQLVPINLFYLKNAAQTLYREEYLDMKGVISGLEYYYSSDPNYDHIGKPLKIYMGITEQDNLYEGWIVDNMTLVFDGTVDIPSNKKNLIISLDKPFLYTGGNLVVNVISDDSKFSSPMNQFVYSDFDYLCSRVFASNQVPFDFTQTGRSLNWMPNTSFIIQNKGKALTGTITDTNDQPMEGVVVGIAGTIWKTVTDNMGKYTFAIIPSGEEPYSVIASKVGYAADPKSVTIRDEDATIDFTMKELNKVSVAGKVISNSRTDLRNVNIILSGNGNYQVLTNENGSFIIPEVFGAGIYKLEVYQGRYISYTDNVVIDNADVVLPDITIMPYENNAPRNFNAKKHNQEQSKIIFSWLQPEGVSGDNLIKTYHIYENGILIEKIPGTQRSYTRNLHEGIYVYKVSAIWGNGSESERVAVEVNMKADPWKQVITEFPFKEGFESGKLESYWREKYLYNDVSWEVVDAVYGKDSVFSPHTGSYFITISDRGANTTTRITTPQLDITSLSSPSLRFWHRQPKGYLNVDIDRLNVYYKNTPEGKWKLLANYLQNVEEWQQEIIQLPAPTGTYWIAFDARLYFGEGVMIDDIEVYDADNDVSIANYIKDDIYVLPNPAKSFVNVYGKDIQMVKICNALGNVVGIIELNPDDDQHRIDLNSYNSGIYIFEFIMKNKITATRKVIIR